MGKLCAGREDQVAASLGWQHPSPAGLTKGVGEGLPGQGKDGVLPIWGVRTQVKRDGVPALRRIQKPELGYFL